jgi:hypothetical protein
MTSLEGKIDQVFDKIDSLNKIREYSPIAYGIAKERLLEAFRDDKLALIERIMDESERATVSDIDGGATIICDVVFYSTLGNIKAEIESEASLNKEGETK